MNLNTLSSTSDYNSFPIESARHFSEWFCFGKIKRRQTAQHKEPMLNEDSSKLKGHNISAVYQTGTTSVQYQPVQPEQSVMKILSTHTKCQTAIHFESDRTMHDRVTFLWGVVAIKIHRILFLQESFIGAQQT